MIPTQWVAGRGLQGRLAGRRLRPFTEKFLLEPKIERPSFNFGLLRSVCLICRNCLDRLTPSATTFPCLDSRAPAFAMVV
jgi:hypothetical protein